VTSRAEAHVQRLALIYAVISSSPDIKLEHLKAALAVWDFSLRSAAYIFGERVGDRDADAILEALRASKDGLTRDEIRSKVFHRNVPSHRIGQKLKLLLQNGLAKSSRVLCAGPGRPTERWVACDPNAKNAEKAPPAEKGASNNGVNGVGSSSEEPETPANFPDTNAPSFPDEMDFPDYKMRSSSDDGC